MITKRRSVPLITRLQSVAAADVQTLFDKSSSYGDSWKKRGGVGAFMMLARKWDRIENQLQKHSKPYDVLDALVVEVYRDKISKDGLLDDIQDLRRYLLLVEDELRCIGEEPAPDSWQDAVLGFRKDGAAPPHELSAVPPLPAPPPPPAPRSVPPAVRERPHSLDLGPGPRGFDPTQDVGIWYPGETL